MSLTGPYGNGRPVELGHLQFHCRAHRCVLEHISCAHYGLEIGPGP